MSRLGVLGVGFVVAVGCTTGEPAQGPREAALVVRTGIGCSDGCAIDRPLLVGTEEIADVVGVVDLDRMLVAVDDASIATAWVESVRLCCDASGSGACRAMRDAEALCMGRASEQPRVVIRALRPGGTWIQVGDDDGEVARERVEVSDAVVVTALDRVFDGDRFDDGPTLSWVDGRVEHAELRAGQLVHFRFAVFDAQGRPLQASAGISARIDRPEIAEIGSSWGECDGAVMEGEAIAIEGIAQGSAIVAVRAGSAGSSIALDVAGECQDGAVVLSDDACQTDADCAPVECCHASACGAIAGAPSCADAVCSLECREDTMDCGGRCLCVEGRCAAYLPGTQDPGCSAPAPMPLPTLPAPF